MDAKELLEEKIRNLKELLAKLEASRDDIDWENISSETEELLYNAIKSLTFK